MCLCTAPVPTPTHPPQGLGARSSRAPSSIGCQTVRRGPYELDEYEIIAIREGKKEVIERMRAQGVLADTTPPPLPKGDQLDALFSGSRDIINVGERVEFMMSDSEDKVSPDSLGRPSRALGLAGQLQQARYMLRRQEERMAELLRRCQGAGGYSNATAPKAGKGTMSMAELGALYGSALPENFEEVVKMKRELTSTKERVADMGKRLASQDAAIEAMAQRDLAARCLVFDVLLAMGEVERRDSVSIVVMMDFLGVTRTAVQAWVAGAVESTSGKPLPDEETLKQSVGETCAKLAGAGFGEGAGFGIFDDSGVIHTEKSLIRAFSDAAAAMVGQDAVTELYLGFPEDSPLNSSIKVLKSATEEFSEKVQDAYETGAALIRRMDLVDEPLELASERSSLNLDAPANTRDFSSVVSMLGLINMQLEEHISKALKVRTYVEKEGWNSEIIKLNQQRADKEHKALERCQEVLSEMRTATAPFHVRRTRLLFRRIFAQRALKKLQGSNLALPRSVSFGLRRYYGRQLVAAALDAATETYEVHLTNADYYRHLTSAVLPLYEHWAVIPSIKPDCFTAQEGLRIEPPLHAVPLWAVLNRQLSTDAALMEAMSNSLQHVFRGQQYYAKLLVKTEKHVHEEENEARRRLVEEQGKLDKKLIQLAKDRKPSAVNSRVPNGRRAVATPQQRPPARAPPEQPVVSPHPAPRPSTFTKPQLEYSALHSRRVSVAYSLLSDSPSAADTGSARFPARKKPSPRHQRGGSTPRLLGTDTSLTLSAADPPAVSVEKPGPDPVFRPGPDSLEPGSTLSIGPRRHSVWRDSFCAEADVLCDDSDDEDEATRKSTHWDSSAYLPWADKPVYASGKVGEEQERRVHQPHPPTAATPCPKRDLRPGREAYGTSDLGFVVLPASMSADTILQNPALRGTLIHTTPTPLKKLRPSPTPVPAALRQPEASKLMSLEGAPPPMCVAAQSAVERFTYVSKLACVDQGIHVQSRRVAAQ